MIGVFGGTFDPVHFGHLRIALEMAEYLGIDSVHLVPARQPPHRASPGASAEARLHMLRLAVQADEPRLIIDERELKRSGPSYMVDTLASLRHEFPQQEIVLMLGMDAFATLHQWHRWTRLIELAHIAIARRPVAATAAPEELQPALADRLTTCVDDLSRCVAGRILFCPVTQLAISATDIRQRLMQGLTVRYLLPDAVLAYIREHDLYVENNR